MRSEKRKPYLEIKQASKDYTETNFKEGGYSNVYLASWNNGLYFEAPNNVREFGLQSLSLSDNKKKSDVHRNFHGENVLLDISKSFEGEENEDLKYNVIQNMINFRSWI
ncbi:23092_t:CDS:2, partial [Rhizophagus irregularis]